MDDDFLCQQFFLEPDQVLQRRYEVLRAFFVERCSMTQIGQQFGLSHGAVRNLVSDFRTKRQSGQVAPFFGSRCVDGPLLGQPRLTPGPRRRASPMHACCRWRPAAHCAPAWPASFCFCLYSLVLVSTGSSPQPAIPNHA
jgi:hypothetical protein